MKGAAPSPARALNSATGQAAQAPNLMAGRLFASSASPHRGPDSAVLSPIQRTPRQFVCFQQDPLEPRTAWRESSGRARVALVRWLLLSYIVTIVYGFSPEPPRPLHPGAPSPVVPPATDLACRSSVNHHYDNDLQYGSRWGRQRYRRGSITRTPFPPIRTTERGPSVRYLPVSPLSRQRREALVGGCFGKESR